MESPLSCEFLSNYCAPKLRKFSLYNLFIYLFILSSFLLFHRTIRGVAPQTPGLSGDSHRTVYLYLLSESTGGRPPEINRYMPKKEQCNFLVEKKKE